jgi:hypothetical protein
LLLPAGTEKVQLYGILDFEGDGPSAVDATADYEGNPVDVSSVRTGITLVIDPRNTKMPPPNADDGQNRPPWEQPGATGGGSGGAGISPGGGKVHTEAPPGAPGGAVPPEGEKSSPSPEVSH